MPMPAVIGCIAQQSAAAPPSAPTNVSIATSSTGNYDDSFTSVDSVGGNSSLTITGASTSVNVILSLTSVPGPYTLEYGAAANANAVINCYLRATGATSYTMQGSIDSSYFATFGGSSISWSGGAFTAQDATGGSGIGYFSIVHGGGGRSGYLIPVDGDWFKIKVTGSATNATGTTNATNVVITYTFADL